MKKEKTRLTLQEKRALRKKREKTFSIICLVVVVLVIHLMLAILIYGIARTDAFSPGFESEELYGCWYQEDDTACWRFSETDDGADVYFFVRNNTTIPFKISSYTDVVFDEEHGTITVYFGKDNPVTFKCSLKNDKLILKTEDSQMVFYRGIPIADRNKEISAALEAEQEKQES